MEKLSLSMIMALKVSRSTLYQKPEDVEDAISHFRSDLHRSDLPHDSKVTEILEGMEDFRFEYLGVNKESTLQEALSLHPRALGPLPSMHPDAAREDICDSRSIKAPLSKQSVDAGIWDLQESLTTLLPGTPNYRKCLKKLVRSFEEKIFSHQRPHTGRHRRGYQILPIAT
jgi:hypothetical protein